MPVPNSMADLAQLASANFPTGTESIGNNLDNYLRSHGAIIRSTNAIASATIASASTTDIGSADAEAVGISGSATINSFGSGFVGCYRELTFTGAATIVNSSNILLPAGFNITTASGDILGFRCKASGVWQLVSRWDSVSIRGGTLTGTLSGTQYRASAPAANPSLVDNFSYFASGQYGGGYGLFDGAAGSSAGMFMQSNQLHFVVASGTNLSGPSRAWLDTSGNFTASGNLTSNSDESLKSDWSDLPSDLVERFTRVKAGSYLRRDLGVRQVGVGASSMLDALPLAVCEGADGIKSVAYGNAALVGVVALARRLLELEKTVKGE